MLRPMGMQLRAGLGVHFQRVTPLRTARLIRKNKAAVAREFQDTPRPMFGLEYIFYSGLGESRAMCKRNLIVECATEGF
jgi:hypothetical protein